MRSLLDSNGRIERTNRRTALLVAELRCYNIALLHSINPGSLMKGHLQGKDQVTPSFAKAILRPRLTKTPVGIKERLTTVRIPLVKILFATLLSFSVGW